MPQRRKIKTGKVKFVEDTLFVEMLCDTREDLFNGNKHSFSFCYLSCAKQIIGSEESEMKYIFVYIFKHKNNIFCNLL
jgi:hypothetical protein